MSQTKITNTESVILALYPHPRAIGFAMMNSPTSVQKSGCMYISAKETLSYTQRILAIVTSFNPTLIILESEKSRKQFRGKRMLDIFEKMEKEIPKLGYHITYYSRKDIYNYFGKITKQEIANSIAEKIPSYKDRVPKPRVSSDGAESPRMTEFDSLALCIIYFAHNRYRTP